MTTRRTHIIQSHFPRTLASGVIALAAALLTSAGGPTAARLVTRGQIARGTIKEIDLDD